MKHAYSRNYAPSMPTLEIRLSVPGSAPITKVLKAIIDTGADGTIAPSKYLTQFQSLETDQIWLGSYWGEQRLVLAYALDIHIGSLVLPAMRVASDPKSKELILGRDVLNKLRLLLDGPAETTELLDSKPKRI